MHAMKPGVARNGLQQDLALSLRHATCLKKLTRFYQPGAAPPCTTFHNEPLPRHNLCRRAFGIGPARVRPPVSLAAAAKSAEGELPDSREESVAQACAAVAANLPTTKAFGKTRKRGNKGAPAPPPPFISSGPGGFASEAQRLSIEIPVAEETEEAALQLADDVIRGLPAAWRSQFTILSTFGPTPSRPPGLSTKVVSLQQCLAGGEGVALALAGCLVIAAPNTQQVAEVERVVEELWSGPVAVLLNAEWAAAGGEDDAGVPPEHAAFALSFDPVYTFLPILIKAFVVTSQEGAVFRLKMEKKGAGGFKGAESPSSESPWRIFMRQGDAWEAVARMQRRPSSTDVEVAFYNASARNSPLTKGAKFLRGLVKGKKWPQSTAR